MVNFDDPQVHGRLMQLAFDIAMETKSQHVFSESRVIAIYRQLKEEVSRE